MLTIINADTQAPRPAHLESHEDGVEVSISLITVSWERFASRGDVVKMRDVEYKSEIFEALQGLGSSMSERPFEEDDDL